MALARFFSSRSTLAALFAGLVVLAPASPLSAQAHPNHAQGFEAEKLYQLDGIENVNVFNGNLNLTIPLGQSYPVGGGFSYGLTAVYSGNVWEWEEIAVVGANGYDYYLKAIPRKRSNAGLGWLVSLGRMNPPQAAGSVSSNWIYESPDGALHELLPNLHADGTKTSGWHYSQDGTYMRFKESTRELELADGTIQTFDASGRLTRWRDRFGNDFTVAYTSNLWTITDSQGRVQKVFFKAAPYYGTVVDRVELKSFGATTATYTFHYTDTTITRGLCDVFAVNQGYIPRTETVPLLTDITLPDGSKYFMPTADYDLGPATGTSSLSGHLKGMKLPTGGKYEWTWVEWLFPQRSARLGPRFDPSANREPFRRSVGLSVRRHENASGTMTGQWTYVPVLDTSTQPKEHKVTVTDPVGHPTVYYFSVYADDQDPQTPEPPGWVQSEYGLPFTRNQSDGTSPARYLSAEIKHSGGATLRKTYLRYENSNGYANHRVASERTVYVDDGGKTADVNYSDFDGLGHYRTVATAGTFAAGNVRSSYTAFNPGSCATCQPATTSPWVLGTYTHQTVTEGTTVKTEACFEAGTGFLLRSRVYKTGTTAGANDVVVRYSKDAAGNVTAEEYFGGDTQALGTGALCSLALPTAKYRLDNTYQYGVLRTAQYAGQSFKSADFDLDANTGKVKTSRDTAGLVTTYEYDTMGRLTYVKPSQEGWTQYAYNVASGTTPSKVWIYSKPNGGGTALATQEIHFDPFGRVSIERRTMADGTTSDRKTVLNDLGWPTSRTEWGTTSATSYLNYDPFGRPATVRPPEGSAHDVTFSYKGAREVTRTVKVGTAWTGTAVTETAYNTTEIYDRQGRLYQVFEPSNPDDTSSTTTYSYDVGGRLKQVSQTAKDASLTPRTQNRFFTYDNRGFLGSETHPEKTSAVTYSGYDARGHVGRVIDGPNDLSFTWDGAERLTQVKETGTGGRVLKSFTYASSNGTGDWRQGKLQVAHRYNHPVIGGATYTVDVAETYTYGGEQGRVSKRDTAVSVNGAAAESFTQSWVWNDLGNLASVTYPKCTHAGCTAATNRTVSSTYTNGFLTGVTGYASSISYHPNGQVNQVVRSNNTTDTWTKDPQNQMRPNKIDSKVTSTGAIVWNSGVYAYDGAGNVVKTGNGYYLYDGVSRIQDGLIYLGAGATGTTATFDHAYDGFGNLQSMTTNASQRPTPTSSLTNRLTGAVGYDAAGALTSWNGAVYKYDEAGMMWNMTSGTEDWLYIYTADDERIWSYKPAANLSRWTLRSLDNKVLREYQNAGGTWSVQKDYVYRGGELLAAETPTGVNHLHTDHLGTVRAITNSAGTRIAYHHYFPFGEEATSPTQNTERMKFTGHERDLANTASAADDLDYMHARFYNPLTGRFLSVDKVRSWKWSAPQTWGRYSYTAGNPIRFIDPDGNVMTVSYETLEQNAETREEIAEKLRSVPIIGGALAKVAAFFVDPYLPTTPSEYFQTFTGSISSFGTAGFGGPLTGIVTKLDNIFANNLTAATTRAAARESLGQVVSRKADGVPFDHVTKFNEARSGVVRTLDTLKGILQSPGLSDSEHAYVQFLVSKYSKKLDEVENIFKKELERAAE